MHDLVDNATLMCPGALVPETMDRLITANVVLSALGTVSSLAAIVLILVARACGSFVYRLLLYLAVTTLCLEVSIGLQSLPIDSDAYRNASSAGVYSVRNGWGRFCIAIAYIYQTMWFAHVTTVAWICVYVFVLSIFKVALNKPRHHAVGICCVFFLPVSISWIPFAFGRYGFSPKSYVCWIIDDCADMSRLMTGHLLQLFVSSLPAALILGVGLVLLLIVTATFCRRLRKDHLGPHYELALREIEPLLIYPTVSCVITVVGCCLHVYMMLDTQQPAVISLTSSGLFQVLTLLLPISLFCHPSYKKRARATLKLLESNLTSTGPTTANDVGATYTREEDDENTKLIRKK